MPFHAGYEGNALKHYYQYFDIYAQGKLGPHEVIDSLKENSFSVSQLKRIEDIANIDSEIIDLSVKTARARIEADSSDTNTDELTSSLKSLNERKVAALASIGKPADYLDDIFTCPYCKDSGYVNGKRCICFNKKAIDLIYKAVSYTHLTLPTNSLV